MTEGMTSTRSVFPMIVWGDSYIDDFIEKSLPTLLAPGNLPGAVKGGAAAGSEFRFYTTAQGRKRLEAAELVRVLAKYLTVSYYEIPEPPSTAQGQKVDVYKYLKALQKRAIHDAACFDLLYFLYPDFVYANGSLAYARDRMADGYDAVINMAARLSHDAAEAVMAKARVRKDGAVSLKPFDVASAVVHDEQGVMEALDWNGMRHSAEMTSWLLWDVGKEGWLFHAFHQHPLVVRPNRFDLNFWRDFLNTLDVGYLPWVCHDWDKVHYVTRNDDLVVCSIAEPNDVPNGNSPASVRRQWLWAEGGATLFHRHFFRQPVFWNVRPIEPEKWQGAVTQAKEICDDITDLLNTPTEILESQDPEAFARRQLLQADMGNSGLGMVSPAMARDFSTKQLFSMLLFRLAMDGGKALRVAGFEKTFRVWRAFYDFFWMRLVRPDIGNYKASDHDKSGIAYVELVRHPDMNARLMARFLMNRFFGRLKKETWP